eukprot:6093448-Prymnesium_polylepis.5
MLENANSQLVGAGKGRRLGADSDADTCLFPVRITFDLLTTIERWQQNIEAACLQRLDENMRQSVAQRCRSDRFCL